MNSRDLEDLHPYLADRYRMAVDEWLRLYPNDPVPFLTQTFRSIDYQNTLYDMGRSAPGKIITNARGGQSLHNYQIVGDKDYQSLAFDIAFKLGGAIHWGLPLFQKFAKIIVPMGVAWGGNWAGKFKDYPHFDVPGFNWRDAKAGKRWTEM